MSGNMTQAMFDVVPGLSSAELSSEMAAMDYSNHAVTLVGFGTIGRSHFGALQALGIRRIRLCSHASAALQEVAKIPDVEVVSGGFEQLTCRPEPGELGIIATPTALLVAATERLVALGFRRLLIEKPVALRSEDIAQLAQRLERQQVEAFVGYNRVAYPSLHEIGARASQEGGLTSCTYTFTEMIKPDWTQRFTREDLARWGVANSLHLIGMAHALIGMPAKWSGFRTGAVSWHPSGAVFVGAGISDRQVPFTYHADWGSTGRWSMEVHTPLSSYRLCPLEKAFRRTSPTGNWEDIPVVSVAPEAKAGLVEQVAALLDARVRSLIPLVSLDVAARLTRYAEEIFGYSVEAGDQR